jgi:predicted transcriptional regulator
MENINNILMENLVTRKELAEAMNVNQQFVIRMEKKGLIKPYRLVEGCRPRYILSEVLSAMGIINDANKKG